jgi:hypothetical protein
MEIRKTEKVNKLKQGSAEYSVQKNKTEPEENGENHTSHD